MVNYWKTFVFISLLSVSSFAQQAIIELESDDTLPIANQRYDDAMETPKDNFSSVNKNDILEKFERGELNQNAFIKLQEEYQAAASNSKDPFVKRKIASDLREKKIEERKKAQEEKQAKIAEEKRKKKLEDANKFNKDVELMTKDKEAAQVRAQKEVAAQAKAKAIADAKSKKLAAAQAKKQRAPASKGKKSQPKKKK